MRILGLDPALSVIGWCVLDTEADRVLYHGAYTCYSCHKELDAKLYAYHRWLMGLLDKHPAEVMAIETPVMARNPATTIKLAYLGGVLRLAAWVHTDRTIPILPQERLTALGLPARMKRKTSKAAVLRIVNQLYPGLDITSDDEADAIAVAVAAAKKLRIEELSA